MIEWDEIDWKRGVATIVLGLLIIAGGIFVLNDYLTFKRTKADLDQNLEEITAYAQKYPPAAAKDPTELEAEIKALEAQLAASKVKLPESYDDAAVKAEIESRANVQGAKLMSVDPGPSVAHAFLVYHPYQVTFGGTRDQVQQFLHSLDYLPFLHMIESNPVSFTDKITITLQAISFDQDSWLAANPCPELIPLPALKETKLTGLYLFKGDLEAAEAQIEIKVGELQKGQANAKKICDLNHELGLAQFKLQALKSPPP